MQVVIFINTEFRQNQHRIYTVSYHINLTGVHAILGPISLSLSNDEQVSCHVYSAIDLSYPFRAEGCKRKEGPKR